MRMSRAAGETRAHILQAASRVILAEGVDALTLEAVARAAGVSKGGLLYHFPSKEALIVGMVDQLCDAFDEALEREIAREEPAEAPGRWLRAYLRVCFASQGEALEISPALLAAVATNPDLLAPVRERFERWDSRARQDGIDPALATAIRLAADGLWFADLGGLAPPARAERAAVLEALLRLTRAGT